MINLDTEPQLYSVDDVARILRIGRSHVYRLFDSGELQRLKVGKSARVTRAELERYIRQLQDASAH